MTQVNYIILQSHNNEQFFFYKRHKNADKHLMGSKDVSCNAIKKKNRRNTLLLLYCSAETIWTEVNGKTHTTDKKSAFWKW